MRRYAVPAVALLAVLACAATPASASHQGTPDRDCSDFPSQASAQDYYVAHGGPSHDPDRLDGEGDGVACESNPCPCGGPGQSPPPPAPGDVEGVPARQRAVILRVIDGDTIVVRTVDGDRTVRLLGIDTPETVKPGTPVQCGGREASRAMKRFARVGERVTLITDSGQDTFDRFGRLLAYVIGSNGRSLQVESLEKGWAKVYVFGGVFERHAGFARAQRSARRARLGVFRRCGGRVHRAL